MADRAGFRHGSFRQPSLPCGLWKFKYLQNKGRPIFLSNYFALNTGVGEHLGQLHVLFEPFSPVDAVVHFTVFTVFHLC